jgi:hypothetical protein
LKINYAIHDNVFDFGNKKEGSFYNFEKVETQTLKYNLDIGYLKLRILLDRKINDYEVKVYQFLDLTGQLGGIFEIAEVI